MAGRSLGGFGQGGRNNRGETGAIFWGNPSIDAYDTTTTIINRLPAYGVCLQLFQYSVPSACGLFLFL